MNNNTNVFRFSYISPFCLIRMLVKNLWMLVAAGLIFAMSTSLYLTWFHKPVYQSNMTYVVSSRRSSFFTSDNMASAREVAAVLEQLLETNEIMDSVRSSDPRLADFSGSITASRVGESNFIIVTASADSPEDAFLALDALKGVFPTITEYIARSSVVLTLRNPQVSSTPINQVSSSRIICIAGLLGAVAMAVGLCVLSVLRETIQTRTGARRLLDAPILASVCHERKNRTLSTVLKNTTKHVQVFAPTTSFAYTEQIGTICTQLEHEKTSHQRRAFLITGVGEDEGKSTVAANVAAALALKGNRVALVDGDLRKPAMNEFFGGHYASSLPLNEMLAQPFSRENLLECMAEHPDLGLYTLFPLKEDNRCAELLSSTTMEKTIQQLRVFDYVIIDSPPIGMFPDAEALCELVDASLLVVRQDYTPACDINDKIDTLRNAKAAFLGCILNDMVDSIREHYGYGSKYGYGGKYGYGSKYGYGHYGYGHSSSAGKSGSGKS